MQRCCKLGWLLSLLVAAGLTATGSAGAQAGVVLRYHHGEGDRVTYEASVVFHEVRVPKEGAGDMSMMCASVQGEYGFMFRGLSEEGMGRFQVTSADLQIASEDGNTRLAVAMDRAFAIDEEELQQYSLRGSLERDTVSGGHSTNDVILLSGIGVLPEVPVSVGDCWEGTVQFPQWGDGVHETSQWKYSSQLVGTETYDGRDSLKIRTTLSLVDVEANTIERIDGICAAEWLFAPEPGLIVKADMSGAVAVSYRSGNSETITYHNHVRLREYDGGEDAAG